MKKIPKHMIELFESFKNGMLPAISKGSTQAYDCFRKAHVEVDESNSLPLEIELGKLFIAVQLWGNENGIHSPNNPNYMRDLDAFISYMFDSGEFDYHEDSGVTVRPVKSRGPKVSRVYKLSHT